MKAYPDEVLQMLKSGNIKVAHLMQIDLDVPFAYTDAGFNIELEELTLAETAQVGANSILINAIGHKNIEQIADSGRIRFDGMEEVYTATASSLRYKVVPPYGVDGIEINLQEEISAPIPAGTKLTLSDHPQTLKYSHQSSLAGIEALRQQGGVAINEVSFSAFQTNEALMAAILDGEPIKRKIRVGRVYLDANNVPINRIQTTNNETLLGSSGNVWSAGATGIQYEGAVPSATQWMREGDLFKFSNHSTIYRATQVTPPDESGEGSLLLSSTSGTGSELGLTTAVNGDTKIEILNEPFYETIFEGLITSISSSDENAQLTLVTSSRWSEFDRIKSRRTTPNSQKAIYPDDDCFQYANRAQETVYWAGRTRSK